MTDYDVEKETDRKIFTERLYNCLKLLSESERNLIIMLFFENKTERECAKILCTSQQNIHKNKKLIFVQTSQTFKNLIKKWLSKRRLLPLYKRKEK